MSQLKQIPKFHIGHFPIGTVIDIQCVHLKFLHDDAEKEYEDQQYNLIKDAVVTGHHLNTPDNWVLVTDAPHPENSLGLDEFSGSIDWVVAIKKRGTDSCAPHPVDYNGYHDQVIALAIREAQSSHNHHHHYDVDELQKAIANEPGYSRQLSRKKRLKLAKRLLPRFKISLKEAIKRDREFMSHWYDDHADGDQGWCDDE